MCVCVCVRHAPTQHLHVLVLVCVFVFVCVCACRYKFALLEARLALVRLIQSFTFSPAPGGLPRPQWHNGIVYSPDCLWVTVKRRKGGAVTS